ncbi:hypothetical protein [Puia dinghuensis]|nr:hypothetical protein [Puia dinghuensis]
MGLKAYDLVWLEGRSAAWRYPCEIEELSAFAPAVEEQPFDRFYKRPVTTSIQAAPTSTSPATTISPVTPVATPVTTTPQYTGEPSTVPGKRIIYVTMPAGRTPAPVRETPREPLREIPKETVRPVTTYASPVVEDYSSQLPSLEEQLVEFSPRSTRRRNARIVRLLAIGACILALLVAGIFIGLSLNKENLGFQQQKKLVTNAPAKVNEPSKPIVQPAQQQLPPVTNPTPGIASRASTAVGQASTRVPPANTPPSVTTQKEKPAAPKKKLFIPPVTKDSPIVTQPAQHREAIHRADIANDIKETKSDNAADKDAVRAAFANQVSVGANGYTVGTLGGINNLQLTVTNRSIYPLDLVVVEIQYIQANKKVYKTENLYFRGIGAGAALMQEAPKSSRGIKVQYRILTISSKEGGLTYSGL